jgi:hypothetical protein
MDLETYVMIAKRFGYQGADAADLLPPMTIKSWLDASIQDAERRVTSASPDGR